MIERLHWKREYQIGDRKVYADVIDAKNTSTGAIEAIVRTSCDAPDGKVHHQTNSITLTDTSGWQQLEAFMSGCAEWLKKLLWEDPQIRFFVAELERAGGGWVNLTCTFNIQQSFTLIDRILVEGAGLPQVGTFIPPESPRITFPVYRARLRFGKRIFETEVLAVNVNLACKIGSNLVLQAAGENSRFLYDLFMTDIVRALIGAARSKERTVLILGSYDGGRDRLRGIRRSLEDVGFEGVMLKDFVDIPQQSLFEKMLMFGSLARFIICDESAASGHLIELKACADIGFVTAILRNRGEPVTWMNSDIAAERTYLKIFSYEDDSDMSVVVRESVQWADAKVGERSNYYNEQYPWRNKNARLA
jgi:hypothetical protein